MAPPLPGGRLSLQGRLRPPPREEDAAGPAQKGGKEGQTGRASQTASQPASSGPLPPGPHPCPEAHRQGRAGQGRGGNGAPAGLARKARARARAHRPRPRPPLAAAASSCSNSPVIPAGGGRRGRGPGRGLAMPRGRAAGRLSRLCLESVAEHMAGLWAKDYADRYLDQYRFRYILGPFDNLAGSLIQELLQLMGSGRRLTRAMLHLLLVPHLTELSLRSCANLVSTDIAQMISERCKHLSLLDLHGCNRVPSATLVDLLEGLPCLIKLDLSETQSDTRVLSAVGSSCRRLRELALSDCKRLSAASLLHLAYDPTMRAFCCPSLQVLSVGGLEPTAGNPGLVWALAFLLLALPSLKALVHHLASEAVSLIHTQQYDGARLAPGFPSLEELVRDRQSHRRAPESHRITLPLRRLTEVEEPLLPTVSAVCPDVQVVTVLLGESPGLGQALRSWRALTHLTLDCGGSRCLGELVPVLAGLGAQLHSLSLGGFFLEEEQAFPALLSQCPALQTFSASLVLPAAWGAEDWQPEMEALQVASHLRPQEFPELRAFSLMFTPCDRPSSPTKAGVLQASLVALLRRSPRLETLALVCLPFPLDKVFERVLEPPGTALRHLQGLSLSHSDISPRTIHRLLSLDNQLSQLALEGCPGIHRRHYTELLRLVCQQGLDLCITWD